MEQATAELNLADNTQIFPKRYENIHLESIREITEPIDDSHSILQQNQKENIELPTNNENSKKEDIDELKKQEEEEKEDEKSREDSSEAPRRQALSIKHSVPIQSSILKDSNNNLNQNYLNEPPPRLSQLTLKSNSNEPPKYSSNKFKPTMSHLNNEDQNSE